MFVRTSTWDSMIRRLDKLTEEVGRLRNEVNDSQEMSVSSSEIPSYVIMGGGGGGGNYGGGGSGNTITWPNHITSSSSGMVSVKHVIRELLNASTIEYVAGTPGGFRRKPEPVPLKAVGPGVTTKKRKR